MFDTFDRTGDAEYPFPKVVVFRALCEAVAKIKGMKIESKDGLGCRLNVKTGMTAFSWGELVSISVGAKGADAAVVSVKSAAKSNFGSATVHKKNRLNIRKVLDEASQILQANGSQWRVEMVPASTRPIELTQGVSKGSVADELAKLAALRDQGVLDQDEFAAQKRRLLGE